MTDLEVADLVVEYTNGDYLVRPIDGLTFRATGGELVLLLGASGCGKTTLLSVLAAILKPRVGSVRVAGAEITALRGEALNAYRRETVGIVFQSFNLIPSLSAVENVALPLHLAHVPMRTARQRASTLLENVGLSQRMGHRPKDLSGGEQQRVAIARALAHDPPVVLADEPTAHLDYIQVESVLRLLRAIADEGRLVVVATHDDRLLPMADRVVSLGPQPGLEPRRQRSLKLSPGDTVFEQGERGDLVYLIDDGEVEIVRVRANGTEELVTVLGPGRYFGELGPMFGIPRSATARAATAANVRALTMAAFRTDTRTRSASEVLAGAPAAT